MTKTQDATSGPPAEAGFSLGQPQLSMRDKVNIVEAELFEHEQIEIPVKHYFSQGVYAREITIPAGTILTGKIHRYEQLNILSAGEISVLTENGMMMRVSAPFTIVSPPGTKRIAYAHTQCVWTTIHGTNETDVDKIEAHYIAETDREYEAFAAQARNKEIAQCHG